jgi:hypothetical protein
MLTKVTSFLSVAQSFEAVSSTLPTPCVLAVDDGSHVDITYVPSTEQIKYVATVRDNSFLAVGYGSSMRGTDMVVWQARSNDPNQIQCYAIGNHYPEIV